MFSHCFESDRKMLCFAVCFLLCDNFLISERIIKVMKRNYVNCTAKHFMRDVFCNCSIKRNPHISNIIPIEPLNCLDLSLLKKQKNQPVVTYKRGPNLISWTLNLTQNIHLKHNSKTTKLKMIAFSSSLHKFNRYPPKHMSQPHVMWNHW